MIHIHIWNTICSISWRALVLGVCHPASSRRQPGESVWLLAFFWPYQNMDSGPGSNLGLGISMKPNGLRLDLQCNLTFSGFFQREKKGPWVSPTAFMWQSSLCGRVPPHCSYVGKATKYDGIILGFLRISIPHHIQDELKCELKIRQTVKQKT